MHQADDAGIKTWQTFKQLCLLLARPETSVLPDFSEQDWRTFVRLASDHYVTPALAGSLERLATVPRDVTEYFSVFRELNKARNRGILSALSEILTGLREIGVAAVPLKGTANIIAGVYDDPADRFMGDIDILVRSAQVNKAVVELYRLDYSAKDPEGARRWIRPPTPTHHVEMLTHSETGVGVEIHRALLSEQFDEILRADDVFAGATAVDWNGQSVLIPSPTHRVIHNIAHYQLHHSGYSQGKIELRQLRELALIVSRDAGCIAWPEVELRFNRTGHADVLRRQAAQCLAFMGLRMPVDQGPAEEAEVRLCAKIAEDASRQPSTRSALVRKLARLYLDGFIATPKLAVNLLNPFWWPQRIRGMRDFLRNEQPQEPNRESGIAVR